MVNSDVSRKCLSVVVDCEESSGCGSVEVEGVDELQARVEDAESSNTSAVLALLRTLAPSFPRLWGTSL
jgi:hypothetical protein